MWPKTTDTAISYCRILLHDTLLKTDAYRTGISTPSVCECGYDSETIEHFILHCPKYDSDRSQLIDTVESLFPYGMMLKLDLRLINCILLLHLEAMTPYNTRKEDLLVKSALFLIF